jgi:hypothetical protein
MAEQLLLSFAFACNPAVGQHALGGFSDVREYSDRLTAFVDDGRIVEIREKLFGYAVAVQPKLAVLVG